MPEYENLKFNNGFDALARYQDYTAQGKLLVVSEENVLSNPRGPLAGECLVIREMAKALYYVTGTRPIDPNWNDRGRDVQQYELRVKRLDVQFDERLKIAFENAMNKSLWKGTPAIRDRVEYWAEGLVAYFDATGQQAAPIDATHPISTRESLKDYDPELFSMVNETMAYDGHVDWRYTH